MCGTSYVTWQARLWYVSDIFCVQLGGRKGGLGAKKLDQSFSEIESQADKEEKLRSDKEQITQKQEADFK